MSHWRTSRFDYLWDLMSFIEDNQCRKDCAFSKLNDPDQDADHAEEYPMCFQIEGNIIIEEPVEELDEQSDGTVICNRYRPAVLVEQEAPEQGRLFDKP